MIAAILAALMQISNPPTATSTLVPGGPFTIATLPACADNQGRYAFVTDLGGGADTVLCDGTYWKHIRLGAPAVVAQASGSYMVTPLATPPILFITGNVTTTLTLKISSVNLYPGFMLYVRRPGLLTGTIGVQMDAGGTLFGVLGNQTAIFVYDGTALVQVQ